MMRSAMQKKLTLRILTVMMVIMTAVAFMPTMADTVWADTAKRRVEVNISYGSINITGSGITYSVRNAAGEIETKFEQFETGWYTRNELVITGTTPYDMEVSGEVSGETATETIGPHTITISGYTHYITFENLTMAPTPGSTDAYNAVTLNSNTEAVITLSGANNISSNYAPGIWVPSSSKLTINGQTTEDDPTGNSNSLTVSTFGSDNAGIGGSGKPGLCGNITIDSGTIKSSGYGAGAGIGGSTSGYGTININGGTITAIGGNDTSASTGSPGIGSGSTGNGGSVTITGGDITAIGGTGVSGGTLTASHGIVAQSISSEGQTIVLSSTGGILRRGATSTTDEFNAIIWTDPSTNPDEGNTRATVYGDALMSKNGVTAGSDGDGKNLEHDVPAFDLGTGTLTVPDGTSVTFIPEAYYFNGATITGKGYIVGTMAGNYHEEGNLRQSISLDTEYNAASKTSPYIHVVGRDEGYSHAYPEYTGEPVEFLEDLIVIDETDKNNYYLDIDNWDIQVYDSNGEVDTDKIIDADDYTIKFTHKQGVRPPFEITGAKILPKEMTEDMVEMEDDSYGYGETIQISVVDHDLDKTLTEGTDYQIAYYQITEDGTEKSIRAADIKEVGEYAAYITAIEGNYTTDFDGDGSLGDEDSIRVEFEIEPASITNANITLVGLSGCVYKGEEQFKPTDAQIGKKVKVYLNNSKHPIDTDEYTVEFTNNSLVPASDYSQAKHLTYAGIVTVTVTAKDINYTGSVSTEFTIDKKSVDVEWATAAYKDGETFIPRREYDGTNIVNITAVGLQTRHILNDDEVYVDTNGVNDDDPSDDLTGMLTGSAVGYYSTISLKDVTLGGDDSNNYKLAKTSNIKLSPAGFTEFQIVELTVPKPALSVTHATSGSDPEKFLCTVKIDNKPNDGAEYIYGISDKAGDTDNIKWQDGNTFDGLLSNTEYWFYAQIDPDNPNLKAQNASDMIGSLKYKTPLIPQEPPEDFELEITLDPNGETYTVTIPIQEGAQYSFDGKSYTKSNVLKKVGPNETVTGYARFPATKTHAISEPTSSTDITPPLTVKTPVISPEDGAFYGSTQVTITCGTKDATIYYTLDGNYPTESDAVYRGPITVTEDTTVSAIAVKKDMTESEVASMDYVYTEFPPKSKSSITKGVKATNDLKDSAFSQKDSITAALSKAITEDGGGYTYQNIAYYDLNLQLSFDNGKTYVKADAENFPEEGVEITVAVPNDTSTSTHDFRVAHMFSETSDRLGITAGEIEKPEPTENGEGLTFTVTGCSPLAIGWVETDDGTAADGSDDENKDENVNASAGDEADTLNAEGQTGNADGDAANAAGGANADGANGGTGADGTGTGADGETAENADGQGGVDGVVDELVNAVTTGDYTNPYFWAAIAIVSLLLVIILAVVSKRRRT